MKSNEGDFLFRTRPKRSGARLIAGPFKAHFNRALRCIALANLGRCCYEKAVLAFCDGYKQCQLAARFVDFKIGTQFRLRRQQDVVSLLEADLI
jgi:hypothetical protein